MRLLLARREAIFGLVLLQACRMDSALENSKPAVPDLPSSPVGHLITTSDTLTPEADSHTKLFAPNANYGTGDSLTVRSFSTNANRFSVYVRFSQTAIADRIATGQLDSARLEFNLRDGGSWPQAGGFINTYRIPASWSPGGWTETGITANCPNDTNTSNGTLNCPGGVWDTTGFGAMSPTSQVLLNNDTRGWISFDVTNDIAAFLAGTANHGWFVAKQNNNTNERIVFWSRESTQQPRLVLFVTRGSQVPPQAPDSLPSWIYAPTNHDSNTTSIGTVFLKNIVIVEFAATATSVQRQAAVDSIGGEVVGGVRFSEGEGHYYLQVPDSTNGAGLIAASQRLRALPQVRHALYEFAVEPAYLKPHDGGNWRTWRTDRKMLNRENWALEAVAAPLAWGCSVGDENLRVATVDQQFPPKPTDDFGSVTIHQDAGPSAPKGGHGIAVAALIGARGNDTAGMTGMMWRSNLHAYDAGDLPGGSSLAAAIAFAGTVTQKIRLAPATEQYSG